MKKLITVPSPLPVPLPGGGGADSYETQFNSHYYQTRDARLQPFFYNRPGAESGPELTSDQRDALADDLVAAGVPFDEQIDYWGWEPYATEYQRSQVYGFTRVPVGTGTKSGGPVNPADFVGPVVAGYLLVSCDINDFKQV